MNASWERDDVNDFLHSYCISRSFYLTQVKFYSFLWRFFFVNEFFFFSRFTQSNCPIFFQSNNCFVHFYKSWRLQINTKWMKIIPVFLNINYIFGRTLPNANFIPTLSIYKKILSIVSVHVFLIWRQSNVTMGFFFLSNHFFFFNKTT